MQHTSLFQALGVVFAVAIPAAGCGHDWDAFDPRPGDAGPGATSTSSGGASGDGGSGGEPVGASGVGAGGTGASGTGGGGAGGGPPETCGGTSLLATSFDDTGFLKRNFEVPNGADFANGELTITLPDDASQTFRGISSLRLHDLRGDAISVHVLDMVNTATSAYAALYVEKDEANYLEIFQQDGALVAARTIGGAWQEVESVPYEAAQHAYWRIRESDGTVHWEASADGSAWSELGSIADGELFALDHVRVDLAVGTDGGEVDPGAARFDDLNGGVPSGVYCKASSFSDAFDDGAWPVWGGWYGEQGCEFVEQGGGLEVTPALPPVEYSYCALWGEVGFDLRDDAITLHIEQMVSLEHAVQAFFAVSSVNGGWVAARQTEGVLQLLYDNGNGETEAGAVPYDAAAQAFWQLREAGGKLTLRTSPDGSTWTDAVTMPETPIDVSLVEVGMGAGTWEAVRMPGTLRIVGYNVP